MLHLVDTHCHLDFGAFDADRDQVLLNAWNTGLERILIPGIDLATSQKALGLAENNEQIFAAVGVHPNDGLSWTSTTLDELRILAKNPKTVAIGEIGLDFYREYTSPDVQKTIFVQQLNLAIEVELPIIIHNRNATTETLRIITAWQQQLIEIQSPLAIHPGVLHSFDGTLDEANTAIEAHFLIGVGGPVTFKNARERQNLISAIPLEHLLIETDAPYLTPEPFRGRRNEPSYIRYIVERIAELKGLPIKTVSEITSSNAAHLFAWGVRD